MTQILSGGASSIPSPVKERLTEVYDKILASELKGLPRDCGEDEWPGITDIEEWRDWSQFETTQDQHRIEQRLIDFVGADNSILHVGVGNSCFAQKFVGRVASVIGISVSDPEIKFGLTRELANYHVHKWNKYRYWTERPQNTFDAIVDNNPTSFACCFRHVAEMMTWYADCLHAEGAIFTDQRGLGWVLGIPKANHHSGFDYDGWRILGECVGMDAVDIDGSVYALVKPAGRDKIERLRRTRAARMARIKHMYSKIKAVGRKYVKRPQKGITTQ